MTKVYFEVDTFKRASLLNSLKNEEITLYNFKFTHEKVVFAANISNQAAVIALLDKLCYNYRIIKRKGMLNAFGSLIVRYGLSLGFVVVLAVYIASSFFLFDVKISGEQYIQIEKLLSDNGYNGVLKKSEIDLAALERLIVSNISTAAFAACRISGNTLEIYVHSVEEDQITTEKVSPITSLYDAVVTRVLVGSGTALVKEGDTVKAGMPLIDCYYETGEGENKKRFEVASEGSVFGRVWLKKSIALSSADVVIERSGNSIVNTTVSIFGIGKEKSVEPPYGMYERETTTQTIFGILPIKVKRTVYYELAVRTLERSIEDRIADEVAKARLDFVAEAGADAIINRVWTLQKESGGVSILEIYCETEQRIDNGVYLDKI